MDPEDARLIAAFREGNPGAVEQVATWLTQAARAYRTRVGGGWDDLRQDLLLEATRVLTNGSFRGEARLRTYLWRVANGVCLKRLRPVAGGAPLDTDLDSLRASDRSPLDQILADESRTLLARLVAAMPDECQELWRRIGAGQSYREMSHALGIAEGTLRVRVLRCRRRALDQWEKVSGGRIELGT